MRTNPKTVFSWRSGVVALCLFSCAAPAGTGAPLPRTVAPCLPCHHRTDRDQVAEWLASPYSEAEGGRGCTSCHGVICAGNDEGGERASARPPTWREAVGLSVSADCPGDTVEAEVAISNIGVGHLLPTGSGIRSLMLEVAVHDGNRTPTSMSSTRVESPLEPFATVVSRHRLVAPAEGTARVSARVFLVPANGPPAEIAGTETFCSSSNKPRVATRRETGGG